MATHDEQSLNGSFPPEPSSEELQALTGVDRAAWEKLVDWYSWLVWAWCRHWQMPLQDIPDVVQEVFHCLLQDIKDFHPNGHNGGFVDWVKKITHSRVVDYYRKEARQPHAVGGEPHSSPLTEGYYVAKVDRDEPPAMDRLAPLLELARPHFTPRTWTAFLETDLGGRPVKELAAQLGMTPDAVRMGNKRIRARLRRESQAKLSGGVEKTALWV